MKRILLLTATNLAVMAVLLVVASLLGVDKFLTQEGLNLTALLIFSAIFGFGGAFISLLLSKTIVKHSMSVRIIGAQSRDSTEAWLFQTVERLARRANIGMPEVGIYKGEANAFATGAFRNSALVAVSTGLLACMDKSEVEAVLGHEIAHVANGDMVTLTLIQGVVNTFVFFLARVIGYLIDKAVFKTERGVGPGYYITVFLMQLVLGFLASAVVAWFSRQREYRADAGSAEYLGQPRPMVAALKRLQTISTGALPESMQALGISGGKLSALFASHPPLEARIAALEKR
ncbi:MAG: protease HtpX [Zoogloeaceae bacterium]|jgi:heat shock protein HtpX|nr:protease HtpX [Zoogloeaceae bacterium]